MSINPELYLILICYLFGSIPFGILAAIYRGKWIDGSLMAIAMLGQSIPSFWLGIMCILYISLNVSWLPISGHVPFLMLISNVEGSFILICKSIRIYSKLILFHFYELC